MDRKSCFYYDRSGGYENQYPARYKILPIIRYRVSGWIFCQISCIRPDIIVSSCFFRISGIQSSTNFANYTLQGIRSDIWPEILYPTGYHYKFLLFPDIRHPVEHQAGCPSPCLVATTFFSLFTHQWLYPRQSLLPENSRLCKIEVYYIMCTYFRGFSHYKEK